MMDFIFDFAPVVGLLFFFAFFVAVAVKVCRPSQKEKIQAYANIPFEEDKNVR
jgi:cbb3-type cytochrome oxidase subunit 3